MLFLFMVVKLHTVACDIMLWSPGGGYKHFRKHTASTLKAARNDTTQNSMKNSHLVYIKVYTVNYFEHTWLT